MFSVAEEPALLALLPIYHFRPIFFSQKHVKMHVAGLVSGGPYRPGQGRDKLGVE